MKRLATILVLLICAPAWSANYFTGDPNIMALYNHEEDLYRTDSSGQGNDMLSIGVSSDTTNYMQGSASADFTAADEDELYIVDSSLSDKFPFQNTNTQTLMSVAGWFRFETTGTTQLLVGKYAALSSPALRSWAVFVNIAELFRFSTSTDGTTSTAQNLTVAHTLVVNQWYHFGVTYNDTNGAVALRLFDPNDSQTYTASATFNRPMYLCDVRFYMGASDAAASGFEYPLDGQLDEICVFNDLLTADEIDEIRAGTYGDADTGTSNWWWRRRHNN